MRASWRRGPVDEAADRAGRAAAGPPRRKDHMRKLLRVALRLGSWAIMLAVLAAVVGVVALVAGPRLVGWQGVIVLSGSMEPTLKVGGIAFIELLSDPEEVRIGDIVTYRSLQDSDKRISHRVIEIIDDEGHLSYRTKGDNSELPDQQLIPAENLVGKVRFHLPYLGHVVEGLRSRGAFLLFVGIPAALIIAGELRNIFRELARGRRMRLPLGRDGGGED